MIKIGFREPLGKVEFNEAITTTENGSKSYHDPTIAASDSVITTLNA
jgi:hypothetical protein